MASASVVRLWRFWRALVLALACTGPALARPICPAAGQTFVQVTLTESEGEDRALEAEGLLDAVMGLLAAQLSPRKLQVCVEAQGGAAPLARVQLTLVRAASGAVAQVHVTIDDALTGKTVSRHVDLAGATQDSVPLAVAVSVDELLRASWAELSLRGPARSQPRVAGPPAPGPVRAPFALRLQAAGLAETDASSSVRLGFDGGVQLALGARALLGLRGAYLGSLSRPAEHGSVLDSGVHGLLELGVALTARLAPAGLEGSGWLAGGRTSVRGIPSADARGAQGAFLWWGVGLEVLGWVRLSSRLQGFSAIAVGVPLRGAEALDGEQPLALLSGPLALGRLGLRWQLY